MVISMPKKRLIDAIDLVRRVLEERDQVRTEVVPRYGFGIPVPDQFGQAMIGGIRKALRQIETSPTVDAVEVVRCKDCMYYAAEPLGGMCPIPTGTNPNFFCVDAVLLTKEVSA